MKPSFPEQVDDYLVRNLAYFNYRNYVGRIDFKGDEKILEVGCGGGNLSRFLAKKLPCGKLVCIDNSKYWIKKSKKKCEKFQNIEFRIKDILNFKDKNYFDSIVIHYVLHDIIEKGKVIEVMERCLKIGGIVYIREPTKKSHGMPSKEIKRLMLERNFVEKWSEEKFSFPLTGKVYEGVFQKINFSIF